MKRLNWLILVAVFAAGCVTASPDAPYDRLLDAGIGIGPEELEVRAQFDGYPLPGATVEVCRGDEPPIIAYTDVQGRAAMRLPPGDWNVRVNLVGLTGASGVLTVGYGVPVVATATLLPEIELRESPPSGLEFPPGEYRFRNTGCVWPLAL
jgi:hypothetical protein